MNNRILASLALVTLVAGTPAVSQAAVETYKIDPAHSSVAFKVRHFFTPVPGSFTKFSGMIAVNRDDLEKSSVSATIEAASVNTANEKRDQHLATGDFFDVAQFASLTFKSTAWKKTGENTFDVTGDLTLKGVTKPVVLKVKLLGFGPGMGGAQLSGWEASATIDRTDFGISYGQGIVGNDVDISITVEAAKQ